MTLQVEVRPSGWAADLKESAVKSQIEEACKEVSSRNENKVMRCKVVREREMKAAKIVGVNGRPMRANQP